MTIMCTWGVCFWRPTLEPELWPFIYFSIIHLPYVSHNLVSRITKNIWKPQSQNVTAMLAIMCSGASCVFLKTYMTDFFYILSNEITGMFHPQRESTMSKSILKTTQRVTATSDCSVVSWTSGWQLSPWKTLTLDPHIRSEYNSDILHWQNCIT